MNPIEIVGSFLRKVACKLWGLLENIQTQDSRNYAPYWHAAKVLVLVSDLNTVPIYHKLIRTSRIRKISIYSIKLHLRILPKSWQQIAN